MTTGGGGKTKGGKHWGSDLEDKDKSKFTIKQEIVFSKKTKVIITLIYPDGSCHKDYKQGNTAGVIFTPKYEVQKQKIAVSTSSHRLSVLSSVSVSNSPTLIHQI